MALLKWLLVPLSVLDRILLLLVLINDKLMYSPLQKHLTPLIAIVPRDVTLGGRKVTLLTANRVTYGRTCLLVVIAACLKYDYNWLGCACVVLNDLLDHVDGIVAKAQRQVYGNIDSPLLGAFVDAFCDKVVNVSLLWTMLLLTDLCTFSLPQFVAFVGVASGVICMECVLGVVRVQDYYKEKYTGSDATPTAGIRANMEGKTKEKLENIGLSLLCVAMASPNPMDNWCGLVGIVSLGLSLRFAVGSLLHKLRSRRAAVKRVAVNGHISKVDADNVFEAAPYGSDFTSHNSHLLRHLSAPVLRNSLSSEEFDKTSEQGQQDVSPPAGPGGDDKVDKVYTVGCFDLFHRGHKKLLKNMRNLGKEVIVGIHNDESYYKLKKKDPIDTVEKRMANVKSIADQVFVISSTDPSPYLTCCIHLNPGQTALYVRGDDMPWFPGRNVIEPLMPIQLLPYTQGISSTQLRAELLGRGEGEETDKLKSL